MRITFLFIIIFSNTIIAQNKNEAQHKSITGVWQNNQFGYQMTLILNQNGMGEFDGEAITYSYTEKNIAISQEGELINYNYSIIGNSLTLSGGDLEQNIVFTKAGTASEPLSRQDNAVETNNNELIGLWMNNSEKIEFKTNRQCLYVGNIYEYEVNNGSITIKSPQGKMVYGYVIEGNELTLKANGQQVSYKRSEEKIISDGQKKVGSDKRVAQELVGKWCWTNTTTTNSGGTSSSKCIVLNANGTYEYFSERSMDTNTNAFYAGTNSSGSDNGTWYVEGEKIYYNSNINGQGSYQLQKINHPKTNDPMILLDGETYVTYYQKSPW